MDDRQTPVQPHDADASDDETRVFAIDAARELTDDKCDDVVVLDVRKLSQVADFLVLGTGTSDRQMRSAAQSVVKLARERGREPYGKHEDDRATWIVADFVDVVVHVFEPNTRAFYDLEMLWGDAARVAWERPGIDKRDRAGVEND